MGKPSGRSYNRRSVAGLKAAVERYLQKIEMLTGLLRARYMNEANPNRGGRPPKKAKAMKAMKAKSSK